MRGNARLVVTDGTAANTASISVEISGANYQEWIPKSPQLGSSVRSNSPYDDGQRLVIKHYSTVVDNFFVAVTGDDQDQAIKNLRKFIILLEKAVQFWTDEFSIHPYWLEIRADCETNIRYAYVIDYSVPEINDQFVEPAISSGSVLDDIELVIEHSIWQSSRIIGADCIKSTSGRAFNYNGNENAVSTISADDAYTTAPATINTAATTLVFGADGAGLSVDAGIRFRSVAIPPGVTITKAYIKFIAGSSLAGVTCNAKIEGESSVAPAQFSTYANFWGRARTAATLNWNGVAGQVAGNSYDTPDFKAVIQEIINLPGWASGNNLVVFIENNGSTANAYRGMAGFDHAVYAEPVLYVEWESSDSVFHGQQSTCLMNHLIVPYWKNLGLSHAWYYDASTGLFSANLVNDDPLGEVNLLPPVPAVGDCLYAICSDAPGLSEPFNNLVYNLTAVGADVTAVLEYWGAAAWNLVTNRNDVEGNIFSGSALVGFNFSVYDFPSNWQTTTVNGVTGYAVRWRVTAIGGAPTPPVRDPLIPIYTSVAHKTEIASDEIQGDLDAVIDFFVNYQSDCRNAILFGSRQPDRIPVKWSPYIPISRGTALLPDGVLSISSLFGAGGTPSICPTANYVSFPAAGPVDNAIATIQVLKKAYSGRYHAFIRLSHRETAETFAVYLSISDVFGSITTQKFYNQESHVGSTYAEFFDLGLVSFPTNVTLENHVLGSSYTIKPYLYIPVGTANTINFFELILFPVDENNQQVLWANSAASSAFFSPVKVINSNEKLSPYCHEMTVAGLSPRLGAHWTADMAGILQVCSLGAFRLHPNTNHDLFFLPSANPTISTDIAGYRHHLLPAAAKIQRYLLARGDE